MLVYTQRSINIALKMPLRLNRAAKISNQHYQELLKIFRKQCEGDVQEQGNTMLVDALTESTARAIRVRKYLLY